ncbi:MAG TPA: DUF692 family protein [Gemmatimonadaceae bacterium]|nr:DUF692 family protein [Gemmatimonadaceae bacterium]
MTDAAPAAPPRQKPRPAGLWIGAHYSAHVGRDLLASAELFDHLVITDPPRQSDPHFAALRERIPMPVHDEQGQLADPFDERATAALRQLAAICNAPWVVERVQCMRSADGKYSLDCVFPPLYTDEMRERFAANGAALRDALGRPLLFENVPAAFTLPKSTISEGRFMTRLCEATRGSVCLNLPHLWVSAELRNLDPYGILHEYPLDRVAVIGTGGVSHEPELDGPWMAPVAPSDELMEFTQYAVDCCRGVRAVTFEARGPTLEARLVIGAVSQLRERLAR